MASPPPPPPLTGAACDPAASIAILEIANLLSVPMALSAVIRLGVPAAIWRSGDNKPLSAAEILPSSTDPSLLQRLLRLLSSYNIFQEHISDTGTRRYSLTSLGQTLVGDASYAHYVLQHHQDALVRAWPKLHDAVLDPTGPDPFRRANGGVPAYEYYGTDPEANGLMLRAMKGVSEPFMERLLEGYQSGFDGVETLVDVGGSSGTCLEMIMKRVPSVRAGVNFDLPDVVAAAPEIPGVTHIGGDMFKSIPSGDAIFMKWILMTWTNSECAAILKKCYEALPNGGKLIACEPVLPEETDCSSRTRALLENDIFVMTIYRTQGRGRTEEEFRQLGLEAGFTGFKAIYLDPFYTVLEFLK
ncbi:O-methyltransferase [Rhynchospora pubera]|uniref:O-methyltransferase n=1 Tax=Rhynchospora pubera TaxID=906938 RepID=A0AAV8EV94_9POAL|nr:O-methyltransferase [Rhynchospora pubera]